MAKDSQGTSGPGALEGIRPDLEGVRQVSEEVGDLPVPRSVLEDRSRKPAQRPPRTTRPAAPVPMSDREREARFRRKLPRAARTPEELGDALRDLGSGARDPQRGHESGPPFPGERGFEGDR